ncbi:MAG: Bifunctional protein GlmU [Candidatus Bathyarchaeota archaeon BA1]|nr:MAG: Bifunctional protein GlmU [Candidatus Bathyarchaeota archaeon BA1]
MKAVVLAGGFGTRLRPLTCTRPKLLFPVGNRPLLDWTLERLAKSGTAEVILAVNYMAEAFIQRYGDSAYGMKLLYSREARPLRTGGPIKKAESLIGLEEPFLVLNGDILTNIDYARLAEKHKENDAIATIALYKVDDPSRYGVVELTEQNRVVRFVEKPMRGRAPSNLANAGIYVLDPKIFDYIPDGRPVSIEHEIFPKLADEGKLYGHTFDGIWIDIGELEDYLKANKLLLETEIKKSQLGRDVNIGGEAEIEDPTVIGERVTIGEKSKIGPYAAIGGYVTVGKGVRVENSIIFPGATILDFTSIRGAIIGENAIVGRWVKIEERCIVGDHALIQDNVTLTKGVTVCPSKEVSESVLTPKCLM